MFPVGRIERSRTLSIVGLEKNTGKTETLNYVLARLSSALTVAVTSIGLDGETTDSVTRTPKPEITLRRGMLFATSENDFRCRRLSAEVLDVAEQTATGRVVTARALTQGTVRLSGPSSAVGLARWTAAVQALGAELTIIDGALSRLSSASPAVSRAMILSTGAALSADIATLVRLTAWAVEKICLECDTEDADVTVDSLADTLPSDQQMRLATRVEVRGALTDLMLKRFAASGANKVVVADFTRLFCSQAAYKAFCAAGGSVAVRHRSELLAITVNPLSPSGYRLDSERLCNEIERVTGVTAYDLRREE